MRESLILTLFILILAQVCLAQGSPVEVHELAAIPDSSLSITKAPISIETNACSVFDVNWVTTCIKCGWKASDSLYIGAGLEECDTAFPFVMPVNGKLWRGCSSYHAGWDIGSDYGTPVAAALWGKVRFAGYCSGYGKLVIVRHYSGMEIYYAHLSKILVKVDQFVEAGDTVGLVGATGHARGNHLHMEFRVSDRALDIKDYYCQNDTIVNLYKIKETPKKTSQPQGTEYHTVIKGDTLYAIARNNGTTVATLTKLNGISSKSTLRIGQRLRIR
jgi:murein DD-endopeptidase MepM/ murein hydrolase activator NlpD